MTLFERHDNPRAVQVILGYESLDITMRCACVIGQDTKDAMRLLDQKPVKPKGTDSRDQYEEKAVNGRAWRRYKRVQKLGTTQDGKTIEYPMPETVERVWVPPTVS